MAHVVVEWTDNLEGDISIRELLELIATAMREANGVFPWAGIRVRGVKLSDYVIADDSGQDAFVNITIKMGQGRPPEFKQRFFSDLFDKLKGHLAPVFDRRFLALSLYVEEADDAESFKHNNIHQRFPERQLMALPDDIVRALADRLDAAERDRSQIGQFSLEHPGMTLEDGYAVSRAWVAQKVRRGAKIIGHKIGLTSRAMQRSSNVTEPDFGTLLDDMLIADGQDVPIDQFIEPRVEVELAFILKAALEGPSCTIYDVLNATDYVTPALEIIDARIKRIDGATGVTRKVFDTISDNAANAGIVIGGRPVKPDAIDLRWVCALLYRNGVIEESGVAAAVLNHPANGPAWLANRLAAHGERLEPGQIVLGGSFTAPVFARPGDSFHADYGPLGAISLRFA